MVSEAFKYFKKGFSLVKSKKIIGNFVIQIKTILYVNRTSVVLQ